MSKSKDSALHKVREWFPEPFYFILPGRGGFLHVFEASGQFEEQERNPRPIFSARAKDVFKMNICPDCGNPKALNGERVCKECAQAWQAVRGTFLSNNLRNVPSPMGAGGRI